MAKVGEKDSRKDILVSGERSTLLGAKVVVGSPSVDVDRAIVTLPENLDKLVSVTFVAAVWPWIRVIEGGLVVRLKSGRSIPAVITSWSWQP